MVNLSITPILEILNEDTIYLVYYLALLLISLYTLSVLVESYMIPSFQQIAIKHNFNEQFTGYLLAMAGAIPELTTNFLSSFNQDQSMLQFGIGAIAGSGAYDFTICLAIASMFVFQKDETDFFSFSKNLFYRESIVYLITIGFLSFFLRNNKIEVYEALILTLLFPLYVIYNTKNDPNNSYIEEKQDKIYKYFEIENNIDGVLNINQKISENTDNDLKNGEKIEIIVSENFVEPHQIYIEPNNESQEKTGPPFYQTVLLFPFKFANGVLKFQKIFITNIFDWTIPTNKSFLISFIIMGFYIFIQTNIIIFLIERISFLSGLSKSFLGMTLISWGNNVGDTINACIAVKLRKPDLLITSIFGTQILNLQFCLGLPWLVSCLRSKDKNIIFTDHNTYKIFFVVFLVVFCVVVSLSLFKLKLNRYSGFTLLLIYLGYIYYEIKTNQSIY